MGPRLGSGRGPKWAPAGAPGGPPGGAPGGAPGAGNFPGGGPGARGAPGDPVAQKPPECHISTVPTGSALHMLRMLHAMHRCFPPSIA